MDLPYILEVGDRVQLNKDEWYVVVETRGSEVVLSKISQERQEKTYLVSDLRPTITGFQRYDCVRPAKFELGDKFRVDLLKRGIKNAELRVTSYDSFTVSVAFPDNRGFGVTSNVRWWLAFMTSYCKEGETLKPSRLLIEWPAPQDREALFNNKILIFRLCLRDIAKDLPAEARYLKPLMDIEDRLKDLTANFCLEWHDLSTMPADMAYPNSLNMVTCDLLKFVAQQSRKAVPCIDLAGLLIGLQDLWEAPGQAAWQ